MHSEGLRQPGWGGYCHRRILGGDESAEAVWKEGFPGRSKEEGCRAARKILQHLSIVLDLAQVAVVRAYGGDDEDASGDAGSRINDADMPAV